MPAKMSATTFLSEKPRTAISTPDVAAAPSTEPSKAKTIVAREAATKKPADTSSCISFGALVPLLPFRLRAMLIRREASHAAEK
jgi:hypothetical protein